jgi:hypothetical protein
VLSIIPVLVVWGGRQDSYVNIPHRNLFSGGSATRRLVVLFCEGAGLRILGNCDPVGSRQQMLQGHTTNLMHKFYTVSIYIHKNLASKCCTSCCSIKSLHSTLPAIYSSPWLSSRFFRDEHKQQPYSNHNKVMSVTTEHTHLYNSYHKHTNTHRAGGNKTGSVRINLTLRCSHLTTVAMKKLEILHALSVSL